MTIRALSQRAVNGSHTPLETEVTRWLPENGQAADVAMVFGISPKTTEIHPHNSIRKLDAQNRVGWTRATIRKAVVPPPCHLCLDAHLQAVAA